MYTNFQDALCELFNNRKIRREDWKVGVYVKLNKDGRIVDNHGLKCELAIYDVENLKNMICENWEILPTTEELLITKGKAFDVAKHCYNVESCEKCILDKNGCQHFGDYLSDLIFDLGPQTDEWYKENMNGINAMWEVIKDGKKMD